MEEGEFDFRNLAYGMRHGDRIVFLSSAGVV